MRTRHRCHQQTKRRRLANLLLAAAAATLFLLPFLAGGSDDDTVHAGTTTENKRNGPDAIFGATVDVAAGDDSCPPATIERLDWSDLTSRERSCLLDRSPYNWDQDKWDCGWVEEDFVVWRQLPARRKAAALARRWTEEYWERRRVGEEPACDKERELAEVEDFEYVKIAVHSEELRELTMDYLAERYGDVPIRLVGGGVLENSGGGGRDDEKDEDEVSQEDSTSVNCGAKNEVNGRQAGCDLNENDDDEEEEEEDSISDDHEVDDDDDHSENTGWYSTEDFLAEMPLRDFIADVRRGRTDHYIHLEEAMKEKVALRDGVGSRVVRGLREVASKHPEMLAKNFWRRDYDDIFDEKDYDWAMFVGAKGTRTHMHYDTDLLNFLYLAEGRKRIVIIPNDERTRDMYDVKTNEDGGTGWVEEDILAPDYVLPDFAVDLTLEAGEAIAIPLYAWHAVENLEPSLAFSIRIV